MSFDPRDLPTGPFTDAYNHWLDLRIGGELPMAEAFDLLSLPDLVSKITLFDVVDDRIFVRFVGADIVDETGQDTTGFYLDELPGMADVQNRSRNLVETGQPYFLTNLPVTWTSMQYSTYATLALPCSDESGAIIRIVFVMIFN